MKKILITIFLILVSLTVYSIEKSEYRSRYLSFTASYMELKDQINHGFVFRGPDVVFEYGVQKLNPNRYMEYSFSLGGGGKTALDSWGFRWETSPVNYSYLFKTFNIKESVIYFGPEFSVNYNIQNYPDLHTGHLNWMTNYSIGFQLLGLTSYRGKTIKLHFRNSLLSLTSRPKEQRDQHYFSIKPGDIIADTHKNMSLDPFYKFFRTKLGAELKITQRSSISYEFHYVGFSDSPEFQQLNHAIKYTFYFNGFIGRMQ